MLPSYVVTQTIARNWVDLYETIWQPPFFSRWASGLSQGEMVAQGDRWKSRGPDGDVLIRFTDHNVYGIMDHYVGSGLGKEIYIPMRVIANQLGAQVMITLFRDDLTSEARFADDVAAVKRDLQTLNQLMTG
ncbi:polyketide cyclase [Erwinia sp. OLTSP20]|uniref:polyketide cyclase n=1 Tax=unclassified Erwinia TaxID=2622719 RepID=UPI000C1A16AC|nr:MULTISPECIES: polyketide cyclase [unclassified Erwinia]PIJ50760.1 polyketide cyclase [Erwinia sp. OAMSP11]PIJ75429.1 polyketide cyclase [Erwinia sp. OLSSP12]PIJ81927.1 polyketide cyclase [Erwinia sp. OLCASP19]PIJ84582.1 polyketide cyclase [Erwinia sp. OLMTSP26]PIJ86929.1 polyketide cyclase [Erwinia sp. OLMDSP33]